MSFKTFSAAQSDPGKTVSPGRPKDAPPAGQPATRPDRKPVEIAPAPKS